MNNRINEDSSSINEEFYKSLIEQAIDGIFVADSTGKLIDVNINVCKMLGYTREEILNLNITDINIIASIPELLQFKNPKIYIPVRIERILKRKDGSHLYAEISGKILSDGRLLGVLRDITELKHTQEIILKEKEFSETLIKSLPGIFYLFDQNGKLLRWNKNLENVVGFSADEIAMRHPLDLFEGEDKKQIEERIREVFEKGNADAQADIVSRDSKKIPHYFTGYRILIGDMPCLIGMGIDITERRRAELELYESEKRLKTIFDNAADGILVAEMESKRFRNSNPKICQMLGYSEEEILSLSVLDIHTEGDLPYVLEQFRRQANKESTLAKNIPMKRKDGTIFYADVNAFPIVLYGKECLVGFFRDITEHKQAEEAVRESEEQFRTFAEQSPNMIFINKRGKVVYANNKCEEMMGYTKEEFLSDSFDFHKLISQKSLALIESAFLDHMKGKDVPSYEYSLITKNGKEINAIITTNLIKYRGDSAILGIVTDITERKHAEEQSEQMNQWLHALASNIQQVREEESTRIAREIHDELGQILTGIKMDLSFLEEEVSEIMKPTTSPNIINRINSSSKLVDGAIYTIRKITTELRPAILDSMGLSAAIEWQAEELQSRTAIKCIYHPPQEQLEIDPKRSTAIFRILQESITNIIRHSKASHVEIILKEEMGNIILEVADNGKGFSKYDINKMKSFGILGMEERASLLNGSIYINSEKDKGTIVRVIIPNK